jgi:hypothetical protein
MKLSQSRRGFLAVVIAGACLLPSISSAAITVVGTGPDSSYFVLESPNIGIRSYEIRYTYSSGTMQDTTFLLSQVLANDSSVTASILNFGSPAVPNLFVNSFTFNLVTETNVSSSPFRPFWAHWVSGGEAGFPTAVAVSGSTWVSGSGISSPYRLIAPGSSDALYYSDGNTPPSVAPIPEPSATLIALLGSCLLLASRRRTS